MVINAKWMKRCIVLLALSPAIVYAVAASLVQIADAIRSSPNSNQWLRNNAHAVARLAVNVESRGETTAYNGSCCYGVLQMNTANINEFARVSPEVYRNWSLQQQVDAWAALTSPLMRSSQVRQLETLGTFDGRTVDANMLLSCVQLGVGNCQRMINSGRCSGFADRNGTTICSMADRIGGTSSAGGGSTSGNSGGTGGTGDNSGATTPVVVSPGCLRDSAGACVPFDVAMTNGFNTGAGISMANMRMYIQLIIVAVALAISVWCLNGVWKNYAGGAIEKSDLVRYMQKIFIIDFILFLALSYT